MSRKPILQYVPGLSLQGKKKLFLILRKNFRGITFFASSETPISVIKISVLKHCKLDLKLIFMLYLNFITIGLVF
jgi:hypothetical protein